MQPYLSRILVYPVKSLPAIEKSEAKVVEGAGIEGDRQFALFDADDRLLNAKRLGARIIRVSMLSAAPDNDEDSETELDFAPLEDAATTLLGQPVRLRSDSKSGFPDDLEATGPTVVGTASLEAVAEWFSTSLDEVRRRFRANLEISGLEPFGEDRLFGPPGEPRAFRIGEVQLLGTNPCARCSVPSMDSQDGSVPDPHFAAKFSELRARNRCKDSHFDRYGHSYRFAVNTVLATGHGGRILRVGDPLRMD